jgi:hypothetical protein
MQVKNIYLYGSAKTQDQYDQAVSHLDSIGLQYQGLFYGDETQVPEVIKAVSTWFPERKIEGFPLLVWDQEDKEGQSKRYVAPDLKSIKTFNGKAVIEKAISPKA